MLDEQRVAVGRRDTFNQLGGIPVWLSNVSGLPVVIRLLLGQSARKVPPRIPHSSSAITSGGEPDIKRFLHEKWDCATRASPFSFQNGWPTRVVGISDTARTAAAARGAKCRDPTSRPRSSSPRSCSSLASSELREPRSFEASLTRWPGFLAAAEPPRTNMNTRATRPTAFVIDKTISSSYDLLAEP